jgi:hypothetical protein
MELRNGQTPTVMLAKDGKHLLEVDGGVRFTSRHIGLALAPLDLLYYCLYIVIVHDNAKKSE